MHSALTRRLDYVVKVMWLWIGGERGRREREREQVGFEHYLCNDLAV